MQVFDQLEDVQENNRVIKGHIVRRIKGGYTVDIGGVEAFLPGSHVDLRPVPDMDALVNQEFEFRVLKINRRRSNVIVSRRVLLETAAEIGERYGLTESAVRARLHRVRQTLQREVPR